ncbi:hypothetical protein [Propionispora sp. 2/2-37]|uniref:hypothetical protein n=1 Tax=Propionispora sp. 2/2-37 TaxID=1677858 RepID=UPI001C10A5FF|nr:hypothetical protein [Propionispora sp. 2/2-37]
MAENCPPRRSGKAGKSVHPQGMSRISNGSWRGKTLQEGIEQQPESMLGKACAEAWYVVQAEPGAEIIYGLAAAVSREELLQAVAGGKMEAVVRRGR